MSAVKGVNVTKLDTVNGPQGDEAIPQGFVNSDVEVWMDEYEAAALADASTIDIAELPEGAKVVGGEVLHDDLGTAITISVGDSDDDNRYLSAHDVASAGRAVFNLVDGAQYVIGTNAGDSRLQILTAGGTLTGTIKTIIYFTR